MRRSVTDESAMLARPVCEQTQINFQFAEVTDVHEADTISLGLLSDMTFMHTAKTYHIVLLELSSYAGKYIARSLPDPYTESTLYELDVCKSPS